MHTVHTHTAKSNICLTSNTGMLVNITHTDNNVSKNVKMDKLKLVNSLIAQVQVLR